jgi:redox-sensing transcriptional repressor
MAKTPSWAVIRRLPRYYRHLTELEQSGEARISSAALGARMGLTASQVRQDFCQFGGFGQQGYGYAVAALRARIGEILGIDRPRTAVIIGAGNLGRALIHNFHFDKYGMGLLCAFDVSPERIGSSVNGVPVLDIAALEGFLAANPADVAVLTLPKEAARDMATRLIACGVKGIWNFTNIDLHLDVPHVPVENIHFGESLLVLSYQI